MVYKRETEKQRNRDKLKKRERVRQRDKIPGTIFRETTTRCNSTRSITIKVLRTAPLGIFTEPILADLVNDNVGIQISSKRES